VPDRLTRDRKSFAFIKRFGWRKYLAEDGRPIVDVELDLAETLKGVEVAAHVVFFNVKDLKIGDLGRMPESMIEITDFTSRGWEDMRFKVADVEDVCLSFYCNDYEARFSDGA
jgi:hypothetical protein